MIREEFNFTIKQRKQSLSQIREVLVHEKFYEDSVQISKNVDMLIQRGKIDVDGFLKKIIIFGMIVAQSLEIRNNSDKLNLIYDYCKQFRDFNLVRLTQKEERKVLIQLGIPDVRLKLINEMQMAYSGMMFPQNISYKSVISKICLIVDIIYNSFADSVFLPEEYFEKMVKCDQIIHNLIIVPIQSHIEQLVNIQFEEETKHLLRMDGISIELDLQ